MKTAEEYQHQAFIKSTENIDQLSPLSSSPGSSSQSSSSLSSSSSQKKKQIANKNTQYRQPLPHYWPADQVPNLGITYCECIQYVFAVLFITVLLWIFIGLKHVQSKPADYSSSSLSENDDGRQPTFEQLMIDQSENKAQNHKSHQPQRQRQRQRQQMIQQALKIEMRNTQNKQDIDVFHISLQDGTYPSSSKKQIRQQEIIFPSADKGQQVQQVQQQQFNGDQ